MKELSILLVVMFIFSSCSPTTTIPEATIVPANTETLSPTETFTPEPTFTPTLAPTATLSPDTMIYQFDANVSEEDRALIKEGVQTARHYLINNFGSDIIGSYVIKVINNPNKQSSSDGAHVNGEGKQQVLSLNVGHHEWIEDNRAWRLKVVMHEFTHLWQHEQGNGWPGCGFLYDAVGLPGSHDPMTNVFDEGHAEYIGFMAAGLEDGAFALTAENLNSILSPVNRNLENDYSVRKAGVYWLIKQKGPMAFSKYCSELGSGKTFPDAFESGFGMTFEKFTEDFKQSLLDGLSKLCSQNSTCDKEKLATVWQAQEGCFAFSADSLHLPIDFLTIGYPRYVVTIADGKENEVDPGPALGVWQANQWKERIWFVDSIVAPVAFKNLFEAKGVESFTKYCDAIAQDVYPQDAFKSAFGLSVQEFRTQFKKDVLGEMASCTAATCGGGVDNYSDKYKLKHLIDTTQKTPNLILNFVDENNKPVTVNHVSLWTQLDENGNFEYAQPFVVPGTLSLSLIPDRYILGFCDPQYPVDQRDDACEWHESEWIDLKKDQVTNLTLQIPAPIIKSDLPAPNLVVKFNDKDGNPIPNLELQVCNYDTAVKDCSPTYPIRKTDVKGVYKDSLRSGKYLIRVLDSNGVFELRDIVVNETIVTEISYQFPSPNLIVKFTDVNASPVPGHAFLLCKNVNGIGDCTSSASLWGWWAVTNKKGVFEAQVEPGEYYILTCKAPDCPPPYEITITGITVVSETEVTTVEYPLYK